MAPKKAAAEERPQSKGAHEKPLAKGAQEKSQGKGPAQDRPQSKGADAATSGQAGDPSAAAPAAANDERPRRTRRPAEVAEVSLQDVMAEISAARVKHATAEAAISARREPAKQGLRRFAEPPYVAAHRAVEERKEARRSKAGASSRRAFAAKAAAAAPATMALPKLCMPRSVSRERRPGQRIFDSSAKPSGYFDFVVPQRPPYRSEHDYARCAALERNWPIAGALGTLYDRTRGEAARLRKPGWRTLQFQPPLRGSSPLAPAHYLAVMAPPPLQASQPGQPPQD